MLRSGVSVEAVQAILVVRHAAIGPIAIHLPDLVETNAQLQAEFPRWDLAAIEAKTGIRQRHIARPDECASDLGVAAAERLFSDHGIDRSTIDFLLLCTQTPDYPLPTTACLLQHRLGLPTSIGALDFNLGCSGFVYGLSIAEGLIRSGAARRVLLITAETYSKYIEPGDRALRPIFGDGAAATLVEASNEPSLGAFVFGTDGSAADSLIVASGGARTEEHALRPRKRQRWGSRLVMDGPALVDITLERIPRLIDEVLAKAGLARPDIDMMLMHQATWLMLSRLRERLDLDAEKCPLALEDVGNTVSSTIPILIHEERRKGRLQPGVQTMMVGFGVGFSWAGCAWADTWSPSPREAKPASRLAARTSTT